ncbi:Zinc finger protein like [Verticillium longisporum]|nr:Zinc finger protein like [Verticillium longisporum]
MHTRTHTGVKPLACNICGRTFSESSNLSKHRRTHNLKGDHVCDMCGKDFRRLDQLRRHVKTKHKNDCGGGMAKAKADSDQSGLDLTFQSSPQFDALDAMLQGFPKLETSPL